MTTTTSPATMTFAGAVNAALDEALASDDSVLLLGEDIADPQDGGVFKATAGLSTKHGLHRVRSTPISEQAIMGAAVGAALAGMRPVAEIMLMNFITIASDQLINHAAKLRYMSGGQTGVPLTVRTATGAGVGFAAQHSDMFEAWLAHVPGLKVVVPSSPADAYGLLSTCIFDDDPCVVIEHSKLYFSGNSGNAPQRGEHIPLGRANVLRPGDDVTLVAYGWAVIDANSVAESLAQQGASVEVIDLRSVAPWDERTVLDSVARTRRAVIVHEAVTPFGVGAEISARINEELFGQLAAPVVRVGAVASPVPYAKSLEEAYIPGTARIEAAVRRVLV